MTAISLSNEISYKFVCILRLPFIPPVAPPTHRWCSINLIYDKAVWFAVTCQYCLHLSGCFNVVPKHLRTSIITEVCGVGGMGGMGGYVCVYVCMYMCVYVCMHVCMWG